jgi:hypothetical protein
MSICNWLTGMTKDLARAMTLDGKKGLFRIRTFKEGSKGTSRKL